VSPHLGGGGGDVEGADFGDALCQLAAQIVDLRGDLRRLGAESTSGLHAMVKLSKKKKTTRRTGRSRMTSDAR
jgi:hypothetical protein